MIGLAMECELCGSKRIVPGPAHSPKQITCLDCGYQPEREDINVVDTDAIQEAVSSVPPMDISTPEAAAKMLQALKDAKTKATKGKTKSAGSGKQVSDVVRKAASVDEKISLDIETPIEYVHSVIHRYTREGESWNSVLKECKDEREYRAEGVLIIAHNHYFQSDCTHLCKQI